MMKNTSNSPVAALGGIWLQWLVHHETNSPADIVLMSNRMSDRSETQFCDFTAKMLFMKSLMIIIRQQGNYFRPFIAIYW